MNYESTVFRGVVMVTHVHTSTTTIIFLIHSLIDSLIDWQLVHNAHTHTHTIT